MAVESDLEKDRKVASIPVARTESLCAAFILKLATRNERGSKQTARGGREDKGCKEGHEGGEGL